MTLDEMIERAMRSVVALQSPLDLIVSESVSQACHRRGYSGAMDLITLADDPTMFEQALRFENPVAPVEHESIRFTSMHDTVHLPPPPPPPTHSPFLPRTQSKDSFFEMLQTIRETSL